MTPALITTLLFALTAVFATQAAHAFGGVRANFGRILIAVVLLGVWAHMFGRGLSGGEFGRFFAAGMIGFGLGGLCMFQAFPRIGSTLSLLVVECFAAVSSGVLAWWILGATLTPAQITCGLLSIGGVFLGLAPFRLPDVSRSVLIKGASFAVVASVAQGISWTLTKSAFLRIQSAGGGMDPLSAAYQRLIGGFTIAVVALLLFPLIKSLVKGGGMAHPLFPSARTKQSAWKLLWVLANALAGPVLGVGAMVWAIRETGNPGVVQAVVATATLVSVPFSRFLEGRALRANYFWGASISIAGTAGLFLL